MARELLSLRGEIEKTITQLHRWADESLRGGWSTHQVEPQRRFADDLGKAMMKSYL